MLLACNTNKDGLSKLFDASPSGAVKWIETDTNDKWYWVAEEAQHEEIARLVHAKDYTKGIILRDHDSQTSSH